MKSILLTVSSFEVLETGVQINTFPKMNIESNLEQATFIADSLIRVCEEVFGYDNFSECNDIIDEIEMIANYYLDGYLEYPEYHDPCEVFIIDDPNSMKYVEVRVSTYIT